MAGYELVSLITGAIKWVDANSPFVHVRRLRGHSLAAPVVTTPALLCRLGFHSWKERRNPEAARTVSALGAGSRAALGGVPDVAKVVTVGLTRRVLAPSLAS